MLRTPPLPKGRFKTVVADPPWSFKDKGSRAAPDYDPTFKYPTMTAEDILALPVASIVAAQAHLYLWTTDAHLKLALKVMAFWGFEYKLQIIWRKMTTKGNVHFGMGHYFRHAHETILFGVRGGCHAKARNVRSIFDAEVQGHSVKPDRLLEIAELVSPGPRIELFAARRREGWTSWGLAMTKHFKGIKEAAKARAAERRSA